MIEEKEAEEEEEEVIIPKRRTPRKNLKRVRFNTFHDSEDDNKESSAKKLKFRSKSLKFEEKTELLEPRRKR